VKVDDIHIQEDGGPGTSVRDLLRKGHEGEKQLAALALDLFERLNPGFPFNAEAAAEWTGYLRLIASGNGESLLNPYSELSRYHIEPVCSESKHVSETPLVRQLDSLPGGPDAGDPDPSDGLSRTLLVLAVGGADTTFFEGMAPDAIESFLGGFLSPECAEGLDPVLLRQGVPRAFISKPDGRGGRITNVESLLVQSYDAGIRHAAVLSNVAAAPSVSRFLERRLGGLRDLHWTVTVQPLLPSPTACPRGGTWTVSTGGGGSPGGHGHGFKYTLLDPTVQGWIREHGLETFLFSNGDNAALFGRGSDPFVRTLRAMRSLRSDPDYARLRLSMFLVWEYFQKGGFAFFLRHKRTNERLAQVFEVELARASGVDVDSLRKIRGGYNTNVALGFLDETLRRLDRLPLALKAKRIDGCERLLFEASFATAMTTFQDREGVSHFDPRSAMVVLAPDEDIHPHRIHISIRKRDEWFAYASSLFKVREVRTPHGSFSVVSAERDAVHPLPRLEGDIVRPEVLTSGEFFEVFRNATLDLDGFYGTLRIDLPAHRSKPRGTIRFEGVVRFAGDGAVAFTVPAGETWIFRDTAFQSPAKIGSFPAH
jgi:hypothetical protein